MGAAYGKRCHIGVTNRMRVSNQQPQAQDDDSQSEYTEHMHPSFCAYNNMEITGVKLLKNEQHKTRKRTGTMSGRN